MQAHAADAASLMRAFGNESRLMILCTLAEGEHSVGELNEIIPLSQSALSQQLARLRREGLVKTRRERVRLGHAMVVGGLIYGLINVRTDGEKILCATLDESNSRWRIKSFRSRF